MPGRGHGKPQTSKLDGFYRLFMNRTGPLYNPIFYLLIVNRCYWQKGTWGFTDPCFLIFTILTGFFYLIGFRLFLKCSYSDPGYRFQSHPDITTNSTCQTCHIEKVDFIHHCRKCGRCVYLMDHHCMYIDNCIGVNNINAYIRTFLVYSFTNLVFFSRFTFEMGFG